MLSPDASLKNYCYIATSVPELYGRSPALLQMLAPKNETGSPPSELVVANALRAAIPRFFSSSQLDPKLKKILDQHSRTDINSLLEEIAA